MHTPPPERLCPNCQRPIAGDPQLCPYCGFNLLPIREPKFFAGSAGADFILAVLLSLLCLPMLVTTVFPLALYLVVDERYVALRNGLRAGLILYLVLILGALAFCGLMTLTYNNNH